MVTNSGVRRMRTAATRRAMVIGLIVSAWTLAGTARGQSFTAFPVPTGSASPYMIVTGPDGNLWFTEYDRNQIGRITPDGVVTEFAIPSNSTRPSGITVGPDGNLWFAERDGRAIGRITTEGAITEFPVPSLNARPWGIAAGPDGNLWFTEGDADKIGRITTDGVVTEFRTPTAGSNPLGIVAGPDGGMWFTESSKDRIGRVAMNGDITEFRIPTFDASPWGITLGPDGNIWFLEYKGNNVGRITTAGDITEFPVPTGFSFPFGITSGPDGNLWFTENVGNKVGRITLNGLFTEFAIPTDESSPFGITTGPDGNLWFTEGHGNNVTRMALATGPCVADEITLCLNDGRFQVRLVWSALSQGKSGPGFAVPLTDDTGYFWFFNSDNVELVIKALDGTGVNGHYWVFYGALSDVQYSISVTDMVTGAVKDYENPDGTLASVADTSAFSASSGSGVTTPDASSEEIETRSAEELYSLYALMTQAPRVPEAAVHPKGDLGACTPDGTTLCLNHSRFQVSVDWEVPAQGRSGHGTAVPITADTGYFWFFDSANVELAIKVLDGTGVNGHYWVFYGALSNVQYTITVTDTETGAVKTYVNPSGTLASVADTSAF